MTGVFVTRALPPPGLEMLKEHYEVEVNPYDRVLYKEEIMAGVKDKDALLCLLTDTIDRDIIEAGENLKIISERERIRPEESEVYELICNNGKAKELCGWEPKIGLQDGLKKTIAWLEKNIEGIKRGIYNI